MKRLAFLLWLFPVSSSAITVASEPEEDNVFTVIIQPDTQYQMLSDSHAQSWYKAAEWMCNNKASLDIRAVLTLGDLVDSGNDTDQWDRWKFGADILNRCNLPILATVGNHDFPCNPESSTCGGRGDATDKNWLDVADNFQTYTQGVMDTEDRVWWEARGPTMIDTACGPIGEESRVAWIRFHDKWGAIAVPWNDGANSAYGGAASTCENHWTWARNILSTYPDKNFIVVNHRFVFTSGPQAVGDLDYLLDNHANAVIAAGGHWGGVTRFMSAANLHGATDRAILFANWQISTITHSYYGFLVIVSINGDTNQVCFRSYSPWKDEYDAQGIGQQCHTVPIQ